jgi:hypothetical protein
MPAIESGNALRGWNKTLTLRVTYGRDRFNNGRFVRAAFQEGRGSDTAADAGVVQQTLQPIRTDRNNPHIFSCITDSFGSLNDPDNTMSYNGYKSESGFAIISGAFGSCLATESVMH